MRYRSLGRQEAREHLRALYWLARELCYFFRDFLSDFLLTLDASLRSTVGTMPNKSFGRIAELKFGPDKRRLATTDNWWETVLWLTPSIIKS